MFLQDCVQKCINETFGNLLTYFDEAILKFPGRKIQSEAVSAVSAVSVF